MIDRQLTKIQKEGVSDEDLVIIGENLVDYLNESDSIIFEHVEDEHDERN